MSARRDDDFLQAVAWVGKLGGYSLKNENSTDDFETKTITLKFTRISDGHIQETLPFEREPVQMAMVDGNGHVEKLETLQPGDRAETEELANAEIGAAAETLPAPDPAGPTANANDDGPQRDPNQPLVGELAAAAKKRR
jgi:hypothetical protein